MSSDGEVPPQPSKRRRLVSSDSDSSEGSIVVGTHRKRRVYRVVSDADSTDDDDSVPKPLTRRKNYRVVSDNEDSYSSDTEVADSSLSVDSSTNSEWQSDWESASEDSEAESVEHRRRSKPSKASKKVKKEKLEASDAACAAGVESDVSDGQSEKCPICLLSFGKQEVATPSSCEHCFCLLCLMEWSKNINTCPVDRQTFAALHVRDKIGGKVKRQIPVEIKSNVEEQVQEDPTYCEVCHQCDREDRMLLCDGCDLGYHLECLNPPMNEVPMDEWYCPDCSRNSQNDAEMVDIDLDEISDLMAEARGLGLSYGRTRTGVPNESSSSFGSHRIVPRTRQTERVRANIRADRNRTRETRNNVGTFDPEQPSTSSSGMDSISETSRTGIRARMLEDVTARINLAAVSTSSRNRRAKTSRRTKKKKRKVTGRDERLVREVRIREYNDDGEEREIVTYVNVAPASTKRRKKRAKRSRKKRRSKRARTVSSVAAAINTVKRRLANTLGMIKPTGHPDLSGPRVKVRRQPSERGILNDSRFRAGISQVSLFGNNLGINYSPPGSDEDIDDSATGEGPVVGTQRRTAIASTRRRIALKGIANPRIRTETVATSGPSVVDLIGTILESQELWHSRKKTGVTLKADGTLLIETKSRENAHSINNNDSPIKKKDETRSANVEADVDLASVNPNDITQAPMYNNPRGGGGGSGGGGGNRGNFRGGYRDGSRHSQGSNQGGGYGGRDYNAGGGRHSYGGTGSRDNFGNREFGPPANYNQNFEYRGPPPFGGTPPFRNRNPQNFRPERHRLPMPERPLFPPQMDNHERPPPPFNHHNPFAGPRIPLGPPPGPPPGLPPGMHPNMPGSLITRPPPPPPLPPPQPVVQQTEQSSDFHEDFAQRAQPENPREAFGPQLQPPPVANPPTPEPRPNEDEDCDIYCDIEAGHKSDHETHDEQSSANESSIALLPPPEPPSGLLDFEDNSKSDKDNDSDQDLVIDDTPKDERSGRDGAEQRDDKYDPFAADSDTNDSDRDKNDDRSEKKNRNDIGSMCPLNPPPMPPEFPRSKQSRGDASMNPLLRLTAYDDDEDEDSQDDCPNFSIYSSETMDVARHTEQELSQQIGPLEPPPLPPDMPDDDDVIVGDVQSCDLADIPEPSDPYVEALRKERQTLSRIPPKKISNDSRGKITFKIGNKFKVNNKLSNLYDELDENIEVSIEQEKEIEEKRNNARALENNAKKEPDVEKDEIFSSDDKRDKSETKEKTRINERTENPSDSDDETTTCDRRKSTEAKTSENDRDEDDEKRKKMKDSVDETSKDSENDENDKQEETEGPDKTLITKDDDEKKDPDDSKAKETLAMSTIDLTEKSSDTVISISESVQSSRTKHADKENRDASPSENKDKTPTRQWRSLTRDRPSDDDKQSEDRSEEEEDEDDRRKIAKSRKLRKRSSRVDRSSDGHSDTEDRSSDNEGETKDCAKNSRSSSLDQARAGASSSFDVDDETENFPLEKDAVSTGDKVVENAAPEGWESEGAYTPCKDERPIKEKDGKSSMSPFESGLEPITPPKDRSNDDLDVCRTPVGYAGLGTEAISETDEAMNFEDELTLLSLRKEKEMEDGEITEDGKLSKKHSQKSADLEDAKRKRKKEKKEKSKDAEKNKENISSENQVAWKKISKSTKDRQYRDKDKRSRSRERDKGKPKKKLKETAKKKEKRKELARYDVRKIVAEKPARPRKDEYGRDIRDYSRSKSRSRSLTRQRSLSRDRRSRSYSRIRSRSRTRSRQRRSWSRDRRSVSKARRSPSRRRSLSRTRRGKRSMTPRRSMSKKRSVSRRRGALSKSPTRRRRSLSGGRRRRRSLSRKHRSRSRDKRKDKIKSKHKSRSRSRTRKRTRSKSPKRLSSKSREKKHAKRKMASRSRSKHRSLSRDRDRNRNWNPTSDKPPERERHFSRDKDANRESWSAQWTPSWSRSNSPIVNQHEELGAHTWSPPAALDGPNVPPKNLTVILTNKEAIKKKKKEKRKESKKVRGGELQERRKKVKRTRTPPPSKEVFASGDNILVSVCFNKENETTPTGLPELPETIPLLAATKRRRRESIQAEPAKKPKKDKAKEKRPKSPKGKKEKKKKSKAAEIAATKKPVAVIDLDQSPFREQTPSPRDVIVLSDDDDKQAQELATPELHPHPSTPQHDQFVSQGPKTPPEPQIKYSSGNKTNNLRPSMMNPLLEEEEEEEEEEIDQRVEEELEMRAQEELELRLKIGPNTPPEPPSSPPTSPDAYDPFDPTKSRSPTPTASQDATPNDDRDRNQRGNSPRNHDGDDENLTINETAQPQEAQSTEKQATEKPKIISMVTLKRASPNRDTSPVVDNQTEIVQVLDSSPAKVQQNQQNVQTAINPFATINPVLATVAAAVQRSAIFNASTPIAGQRNIQQPNRISPSTQAKQRINDRPQLPNLFANAPKPTPIRMQKSLQNKNVSTLGQNGSDATLEMSSDNVLDMSSPYSPGSSLSDGIFDPPSPGNHNASPTNATNANKVAMSKNKPTEKKDAFDALFGTSPAMKPKGRAKKTVDKEKRPKKSTNPKVGVRMDENQLQILDDLPSSAVEMQVKDKFLKKLNRQERVVEEVKLVLKPHYTKKHVTKEEYKDIMRKAVPKICHNKTGEINPKKIAQLIEAYVRKCRSGKKRKLPAAIPLNSTGKTVKPMKNLWS